MVRDFFVGEALSDEGNKLLFAAGEPEAQTSASARQGGGVVFKVAEQRVAERPGTNSFTGVNGANGCKDFVGGSIAQEVASDAGAHALQKLRGVPDHAHQQNARVREAGTGLVNRS